LFSWTTYGVGCLIKALVTRFHKEREQARKNKDAGAQYSLELIAVAERLLAFGYTGSSRVLVKDLMEPLWTTLALAAHTTPLLNPNIVGTTNGSQYIRIQFNHWPLRRRDDMPARASATALELTYSPQLAHVSEISLSFPIHDMPAIQHHVVDRTLLLMRSSTLPWITLRIPCDPALSLGSHPHHLSDAKHFIITDLRHQLHVPSLTVRPPTPSLP
jgi:hypothetical protein